MSATDWVAATGTVLLAVVMGALLLALVQVTATLRALRGTVDDLRASTALLVGDLRGAVRDAQGEVDRVDALLTTAEAIGDRVDTASKLVSRTVTSPVVKVLALGTGTKKAVRRIRTGDSGLSRTAQRKAGARRGGRSA